jgi:hypothetical protein
MEFRTLTEVWTGRNNVIAAHPWEPGEFGRGLVLKIDGDDVVYTWGNGMEIANPPYHHDVQRFLADQGLMQADNYNDGFYITQDGSVQGLRQRWDLIDALEAYTKSQGTEGDWNDDIWTFGKTAHWETADTEWKMSNDFQSRYWRLMTLPRTTTT